MQQKQAENELNSIKAEGKNTVLSKDQVKSISKQIEQIEEHFAKQLKEKEGEAAEVLNEIEFKQTVEKALLFDKLYEDSKIEEQTYWQSLGMTK